MTREELVQNIKNKKSYLCVGLDTDLDKLPPHFAGREDAVVAFNKAIIEATKDLCVSYKINTAFYESRGAQGWADLAETVAAIPRTHFTIADAKRGDIGNTAHQYAKAFFETMDFDAITVAPYMGQDSVRPFLEYEGKWAIVLGLTSNPGANDFEMLKLEPGFKEENLRPKYLYEAVLEKTASWGSTGNLMFVVGATQATSFKAIRDIVPDHFLLVPGVGFQGGSLADVSHYAMNADVGLLVNVSRSIIYAGKGENFAEEARTIAAQYAEEMSRYIM